MRKRSRRNLTRIQRKTSAGKPFCGWEVRLQRRGVSVRRFFNDAKWGGNRPALRAAQKFRDELESQTRRFRVAELAKKPSKRNRSGLVGVWRQPPRGVSPELDPRTPMWIAQWTDGHGKRKTRAFSIIRYGEKEAKKLARQARRLGVRKSGR